MTTTDRQTEAEKPQSLLVKALEESPGGNLPIQQIQLESQDSFCSSINSHSQFMNHCYPEPFIQVSSDFTIPTSNLSGHPPPQMLSSGKDRRSLFGGRVQKRYGYLETAPTAAATWKKSGDDRDSSHSLPSIQASPLHIKSSTHQEHHFQTEREDSDLTPPSSPNRSRRDLLSPITPYSASYGSKATSGSIKVSKRALRAHETAHAQALILGIAFMAIWSPQNLMAPNLTQMAQEFGFSDKERDVYLGANIALATGVLSLPISAFIGVLADMYNRKLLFCITVIAGGLSSWATGASTTYRALFFARLLNGGFMSGSVPVVFSLLGDFFAAGERNTASSGLTAMMGMGIIFGQVYAGVVGSAKGWSHAFYVSAVLSLVSALLVFVFVKEPVRGGQEEVLKQMLKSGTKYDRKLTFQGFIHAMKNNESNVILLWQGFASSVPWGIIFIFLNDYLSQERGFSVPDATYLVAVFGAGCAIGGILGGYWGQLLMLKDRSYLPWFMSATTFLGIIPFLILLNVHFPNAHGWGAVLCALSGGLIASLPSVNVRPCLINVNPPETRGAALTAANLIINVARGAGPSCITLMGAVFQFNRQFSFNVTVRFSTVLCCTI